MPRAVKAVFVDTSGFYAVLDGTDPFHPVARGLFERAECEQWQLWTTNCLSFGTMKRLQITEAIANDAHFTREQIRQPKGDKE